MKNYDNYFLAVEDYAAARKFYAETLGLPVKFEFAEMGMVAFAVGDEEPAIILKDKKKFPDAQTAVWIEVDDARKMYADLQGRGISFRSAPFRIHTGWAVEFTDPDGNLLGFTDYLKER
ncbi:MAG: VOC family protein [Bacteroidales bacterium]|nr:VOC family protein [Bacteroidales bacterium]